MTGAVIEAEEAGLMNQWKETAERFLESAAFLPAGTGMELMISLPGEGRAICMVLGDADARLEDYRWIFGPYAHLKEADPEGIRKAYPEKAFSYVFREGDHGEGPYRTDEIENLYRALRRHDAVVRIRAEKNESKEPVLRARMELGVPASLMLRALLGSHLVRMKAVPLSEAEEKNGMKDRVTSSCAGSFIQMILDLAKIWEAECFWKDEEEKGQESSGKETPKEQSGPAENGPEWSGLIEDMDFSIRTYNCLKRAGCHTFDDIRDLGEEDLGSIRNLGRKSIAEIQEKIEEFRFRPVRKEKETEKTDYSAMLDHLIGLSGVKAQVRRIRAMARMKKDMAEKGMDPLSFSLHMGFLGNPGTAKTTAARILGGILYEEGILESDQILEVGRGDLVGRYVGETAQKVRKLFSLASGRMIFIDEAYSLLEPWEGSYGDEAINTIVQEMENRRNSVVVVFAGYPDRMIDFFDRNPGLRSRVPFMVPFDDYDIEELLSITRLEAEKRGFGLSPDSEEKIREICGSFIREKQFGNGRFCRNLVENAVLTYAERTYMGGSGDGHAAEFVLTGQDFRMPERKDRSRDRRIGFG